MWRNMKLNNLAALTIGLAVLGVSASSDAYNVRINGVLYDASAKPTVTIAGAGTDSLDITITGGIELGSSPTVAVVDAADPVDTPSDPDPVDTPSDPDPVDTPSDPDPVSSASSACNAARIDCSPYDLGPKGDGWSGSAVIKAGTVLSFAFSHSDANPSRQQYGAVSIVGKTGANSQGYRFRSWFSKEPGGDPLSNSYCFKDATENDEFKWNQNKTYPGYCRLPDSAGTVYLNYGLCNSDRDDLVCGGSKVEFAPADFKFLISPRVIRY